MSDTQRDILSTCFCLAIILLAAFVTLVPVGLAEGVVLGITYQVAGVSSAVLWAAATGVLAIITEGQVTRAPSRQVARSRQLFFK